MPRLLEAWRTLPFPEEGPLAVRIAWALRWRLGSWFRLDQRTSGVGARVPSLRERLPDDLTATPIGPAIPGTPFTPVYSLADEFVAEMANKTVHCLLHLGWVSGGSGAYHGQMAVLVRPNGRLGAAYMNAIKPLRYALVYPALLRAIEKQWHRADDTSDAAHG